MSLKTTATGVSQPWNIYFKLIQGLVGSLSKTCPKSKEYKLFFKENFTCFYSLLRKLVGPVQCTSTLDIWTTRVLFVIFYSKIFPFKFYR